MSYFFLSGSLHVENLYLYYTLPSIRMQNYIKMKKACQKNITCVCPKTKICYFSTQNTSLTKSMYKVLWLVIKYHKISHVTSTLWDISIVCLDTFLISFFNKIITWIKHIQILMFLNPSISQCGRDAMPTIVPNCYCICFV